uniref:WAP domain-containing protein n=1 Tax=Gouania willdenowi TaxID=441366 RepID=A0A8C5DAC0_GOUWI
PRLHLHNKPGTCPREQLHIDFSHCHDWKKCNNDYDCPGEGKCCNTRCGQKYYYQQEPIYHGSHVLFF